MAHELSQHHIVCLGGGIGTVNLLRGLKAYTSLLSVVVSMADDGGSAGRLRRLYGIMPPGDVVSCLQALSAEDDPRISKLLTYRFPGERYSSDNLLDGHKLGNLMMAAAIEITGDFKEAIRLLKHLFHVQGNIYPATSEPVSISALTTAGTIIRGEEQIDLGKYEGVLEKVQLYPENPAVLEQTLESIEKADMLIAGPGDLYTTLLPVLIIPAIGEAIKRSRARKLFVVNVANKPFETKGYMVSDFIKVITRHLGPFPFDAVVVNTNFSIAIPSKYHYTYVPVDEEQIHVPLIKADLVNTSFPLYHDTEKLASAIAKTI